LAVRVIIAEDEAIVRLDLKEILEEQGYQVVGETGRGDEVLDLVRQQRPDLAILDIKMPGADGLAAAREITEERLAAVLVLTAFSQRNLIEEARDAGALAYLVKPFHASDLVPAIEVALGRHAEMEALAEAKEALLGENQRMAEHGMKEADAFQFIQRTAMRERTLMREIARQVVEGELAP
jgi:response regulator NasT